MSKDITTLVDSDLAQKFKEAENRTGNIQAFIEDFLQQFVSEQTKKLILET